MVDSSELECDSMRATLLEHLPELRRRYCVDSLKIFGSYVRGEQLPGSDLDILVTFSTPPGLLEFVGLKLDLADLLGVDVDLVMESALKPRMGESILREAIPV